MKGRLKTYAELNIYGSSCMSYGGLLTVVSSTLLYTFLKFYKIHFTWDPLDDCGHISFLWC